MRFERIQRSFFFAVIFGRDHLSRSNERFDTDMPGHPHKLIAHRWFAAFNAHDLEALLALYADDAEHFSPKLKVRHPEANGLIRGKSALRAWWRDAFDRLPGLRYEVAKLTADDEQVFMEYTRHVEGEEDLRVGEVLEIKDGLIVASRVYHG